MTAVLPHPSKSATSNGRRRDNIPRSTLDRFAIHYDDDTITRADIFHHVHAVLHHPEYRARYAENLKRELPRIPFVPPFLDRINRMDRISPPQTGKRNPSNPRNPANPVSSFHTFANAGRKLAELHVHYERQKEWKLQRIEDKDTPLDWRVEAMKLVRALPPLGLP